MLKKILGATALVAMLAIAATSHAEKKLKGGIVRVPTGDNELAAAVKRARETLDVYWKAADSKNAAIKKLSIKVRIADKNGVEHVWTSFVIRKNDGFAGLIANNPALVKSVKLGQLYKFKKSDISDWMYMKGGKIYGGFTIRALVGRMPKAQGDKFKAALAYEP
jgi:uncharacterized protein YegJ (DUF2314 family)